MSDVFRYPDVGLCFYGGATNDLTDEHIIPFSLGGTLILPKSSCNTKIVGCNAKTTKFEGVIARQVFGKFRARFGVQTRRPKERPTHFEFSTADGPRMIMICPLKTEPV
jgi:hypothetical protein